MNIPVSSQDLIVYIVTAVLWLAVSKLSLSILKKANATSDVLWTCACFVTLLFLIFICPIAKFLVLSSVNH